MLLPSTGYLRGCVMYIIDRYLLRQYVQNFLICFVSLMGLFIVIDAFTHLGEFMRCSKQGGNVASLMVHYYAFKLLYFFDLTANLLGLMAAMFTVSWIQRHNEMTALLAAGISVGRVVRPIIFAAIGVVVLAVVNREWLLPKYSDEVARMPKDLTGDRPRLLEAPCYDDETEILISGRFTIAKEKCVTEPEFRLPAWLSEYGSPLTADRAYYRAREGERPNGYLLDNMREPKDLASRPSLSWNNQRVLITPRDAPDWLKPNQCFLVSNLSFEHLTGNQTRNLWSIPQLVASIRNPSLDYDPKTRVLIHMRIVHPLADVVLLFLGLPLILVRESRNVFIAMGMCMAVTGAFTGMMFVMQFLGECQMAGITPALAAWAPLILFTPIAVAIAEPLRE
jgi:lipopolysaccharide export system permease protein